MTADDASNPWPLATASRHLPEMPTTRLYLDVKEPPGYYTAAVAAASRTRKPASADMALPFAAALRDVAARRVVAVAPARRRPDGYGVAVGTPERATTPGAVRDLLAEHKRHRPVPPGRLLMQAAVYFLMMRSRRTPATCLKVASAAGLSSSRQS